MDDIDITPLVEALQKTPSPKSELRHYADLGVPHYYYEAAGGHDPPYSDEEEDRVVEAKKLDPPAADEVYENLFLGNKGAAESTDFLVKKGITHVLNLASDTSLRFFVAPEKDELQKNGIELKEMKLRDRKGENICAKFRESGLWIRSSLQSGGKVMVNCWQEASRSATIVLAYLIQHHQIPLIQAIKLVKSKRDIRPNNGFLQQLQLLENQVTVGTNEKLVDLKSEHGQNLLERSRSEGTCKFDAISTHFAKQIWKSFCGVQSVCIVLNGLECSPTEKKPEKDFTETDFWTYDMSKSLDESVVRRQGMTLAQCTELLNNAFGICATGRTTDETGLEEFRKKVQHAMSCKDRQIIVNYHMETLGQLAGLSGHISPLAAYSRSEDVVLLMDVWPETRECWVPIDILWKAMDTEDRATDPSTKRGFIVVNKH